MIAGYAWPWVSKKDPALFDIEIEDNELVAVHHRQSLDVLRFASNARTAEKKLSAYCSALWRTNVDSTQKAKRMATIAVIVAPIDQDSSAHRNQTPIQHPIAASVVAGTQASRMPQKFLAKP